MKREEKRKERVDGKAAVTYGFITYPEEWLADGARADAIPNVAGGEKDHGAGYTRSPNSQALYGKPLALLRTNPIFNPPKTTKRLQVNRGVCRFRRYKAPRRLQPPLRASRVSHHLPSPTAVRSTNRLSLRGSILDPWPARPKWAPTTVSLLGCIVLDRQSTLNMALTLASIAFPSPRLIFSFLQSVSLRSLSVDRGRLSSHLFLL